jgi:predicted enzyme related to lactoylglutathione lyase
MNQQAPAGSSTGRFVWHDLMTTDAARSQRFYCDLFGWQIQEVPMQGFTYRMIVAGPGPIGGIVEEKNIPCSHWMPYLAVADVDAMAARIQKANGTVCVPPTDIPNTGRFAVVGDPQGAYFSIYKGATECAGADPDLPVAGRVCWNELLTTDDGAAQRFYGALFGWKEQPKDMGPMGTYRVQMLGDKQAGGIMRNPQNGAPSAWLAYFLAPDLAAATAKAKQLGAKPCVENMPIEGIGAFSMLIDPVGAVFALFAPAMAAPTPGNAAGKPAAKTAKQPNTTTATSSTKATPRATAQPAKPVAKSAQRQLAKAAPKTAPKAAKPAKVMPKSTGKPAKAMAKNTTKATVRASARPTTKPIAKANGKTVTKTPAKANAKPATKPTKAIRATANGKTKSTGAKSRK